MREKCLPLLLFTATAVVLINADRFKWGKDGQKPSFSCILWGDAGCQKKCDRLCTTFHCTSWNPKCNTVFCDCQERLPIKSFVLVPNGTESDDLPPDITLKQLMIVKFMRTPVFREIYRVMPTVPDKELEVKKYLYSTDLSGKDLKRELRRRFPKLRYLFRRLRPRPLAQLGPSVSAEVLKENLNSERIEEPDPTPSYFSSWFKPKPPKPKKVDINSPENQKRIIELIKKLPYKSDIKQTFEKLRDSPLKPLYQDICRHFLREGMKSPDGAYIVQPTTDPNELERKVQSDDIIRQLQNKIDESNEQKRNRKRKRPATSAENSSEEDDEQPNQDQPTSGNGWWSPPLWGNTNTSVQKPADVSQGAAEDAEQPNQEQPTSGNGWWSPPLWGNANTSVQKPADASQGAAEDAEKPNQDQPTSGNGWWSPPLWGNTNTSVQKPADVSQGVAKPSGDGWWRWGNWKSSPKDQQSGQPANDANNRPNGPPMLSNEQQPDQGQNSGKPWTWPSWNWSSGSSSPVANMPNPNQPSPQPNPTIVQPPWNWPSGSSSPGSNMPNPNQLSPQPNPTIVQPPWNWPSESSSPGANMPNPNQLSPQPNPTIVQPPWNWPSGSSSPGANMPNPNQPSPQPNPTIVQPPWNWPSGSSFPGANMPNPNQPSPQPNPIIVQPPWNWPSGSSSPGENMPNPNQPSPQPNPIIVQPPWNWPSESSSPGANIPNPNQISPQPNPVIVQPPWNWPSESSSPDANIPNPNQPSPQPTTIIIQTPWNGPSGPSFPGANISNPDQFSPHPNPIIVQPPETVLKPINPSTNELLPKKTSKKLKRKQLRKIQKNKNLPEDVLPDMESIEKFLDKPKKKRRKHRKGGFEEDSPDGKLKRHKTRKHSPDSDESESDEISSEEVAPQGTENATSGGVPSKKRKQNQKKPEQSETASISDSDSDESSSEEMSPEEMIAKYKKEKKNMQRDKPQISSLSKPMSIGKKDSNVLSNAPQLPNESSEESKDDEIPSKKKPKKNKNSISTILTDYPTPLSSVLGSKPSSSIDDIINYSSILDLSQMPESKLPTDFADGFTTPETLTPGSEDSVPSNTSSFAEPEDLYSANLSEVINPKDLGSSIPIAVIPSESIPQDANTPITSQQIIDYLPSPNNTLSLDNILGTDVASGNIPEDISSSKGTNELDHWIPQTFTNMTNSIYSPMTLEDLINSEGTDHGNPISGELLQKLPENMSTNPMPNSISQLLPEHADNTASINPLGNNVENMDANDNPILKESLQTLLENMPNRLSFPGPGGLSNSLSADNTPSGIETTPPLSQSTQFLGKQNPWSTSILDGSHEDITHEVETSHEVPVLKSPSAFLPGAFRGGSSSLMLPKLDVLGYESSQPGSSQLLDHDSTLDDSSPIMHKGSRDLDDHIPESSDPLHDGAIPILPGSMNSQIPGSDPSTPNISSSPSIKEIKQILRKHLPPESIPSDEKLKALADELKTRTSSSDPSTPLSQNVAEVEQLLSEGFLPGNIPSDEKLKAIVDELKSGISSSNPSTPPLPSVAEVEQLLSKNLPPSSMSSDEKFKLLMDGLKSGTAPSNEPIYTSEIPPFVLNPSLSNSSMPDETLALNLIGPIPSEVPSTIISPSPQDTINSMLGNISPSSLPKIPLPSTSSLPTTQLGVGLMPASKLPNSTGLPAAVSSSPLDKPLISNISNSPIGTETIVDHLPIKLEDLSGIAPSVVPKGNAISDQLPSKNNFVQGAGLHNVAKNVNGLPISSPQSNPLEDHIYVAFSSPSTINRPSTSSLHPKFASLNANSNPSKSNLNPLLQIPNSDTSSLINDSSIPLRTIPSIGDLISPNKTPNGISSAGTPPGVDITKNQSPNPLSNQFDTPNGVNSPLNKMDSLTAPLSNQPTGTQPKDEAAIPKSSITPSVNSPSLSSQLRPPMPISMPSIPLAYSSPPSDEEEDLLLLEDDEIDISDNSMEFLHNRPKTAFISPEKPPSNPLGESQTSSLKNSGSPNSVPLLPLQAPHSSPASQLSPKDLDSDNNTHTLMPSSLGTGIGQPEGLQDMAPPQSPSTPMTNPTPLPIALSSSPLNNLSKSQTMPSNAIPPTSFSSSLLQAPSIFKPFSQNSTPSSLDSSLSPYSSPLQPHNSQHQGSYGSSPGNPYASHTSTKSSNLSPIPSHDLFTSEEVPDDIHSEEHTNDHASDLPPHPPNLFIYEELPDDLHYEEHINDHDSDLPPHPSNITPMSPDRSPVTSSPPPGLKKPSLDLRKLFTSEELPPDIISEEHISSNSPPPQITPPSPLFSKPYTNFGSIKSLLSPPPNAPPPNAPTPLPNSDKPSIFASFDDLPASPPSSMPYKPSLQTPLPIALSSSPLNNLSTSQAMPSNAIPPMSSSSSLLQAPSIFKPFSQNNTPSSLDSSLSPYSSPLQPHNSQHQGSYGSSPGSPYASHTSTKSSNLSPIPSHDLFTSEEVPDDIHSEEHTNDHDSHLPPHPTNITPTSPAPSPVTSSPTPGLKKPSLDLHKLFTSEELPSDIISEEHSSSNSPPPQITPPSPLFSKPYTNFGSTKALLSPPPNSPPPNAPTLLSSTPSSLDSSLSPYSSPLQPHNSRHQGSYGSSLGSPYASHTSTKSSNLSPIPSHDLFTSEEVPDDIHSEEHTNDHDSDLPPHPINLSIYKELPDDLHYEEHINDHDSDLPPHPPNITPTSPAPSSVASSPPPGLKKPSLDLRKLFTSEELPSDIISEEHSSSNSLPTQITPPSPLFSKPYTNFGSIKSLSSPPPNAPPPNAPTPLRNSGNPAIYVSFDDLPASPPSFMPHKPSLQLLSPMANFDMPITLPKAPPLNSQADQSLDEASKRKNSGQNWRQKLFQKKPFQTSD